MYFYGSDTYAYAGQNSFYRWGKKAQEKVEKYLIPNEKGFYSIPADGGKYWTIGVSEGRYGLYAKFGDKFLSVNDYGNVWAKVGTEKEQVFLALVKNLLEGMRNQ